MLDLNIALIQTHLHWHNADANRQHFAEKIAPIKNADLIILPEMFTTGFTMDSATQAEAVDTVTLQWMQGIANKKRAVVTGSVATNTGSGCVNRLYWVRPDGSFDHYDKQHLFSMAGEHNAYVPGKNRLITERQSWRICPLICYDLRFPVWSRNRNDYDLLIYVANWPDKRRQHWIKLLQARAIENQCWCIGVNRIGQDGNQHRYAGDSLVCNPLGEIVADAQDQDTIISYTLSGESLVTTRQSLPFLADADAFEWVKD